MGDENGHHYAALESRSQERPVLNKPAQSASTRGAEPDSLRIVVVDDHDLFRTGLKSLLEEHGVAVVAEAATGEQALRLVLELAPDVVVMDLNMPGMTGVEATRKIVAAAPLSRVVVLTISDQDADVLDAIVAGDGFEAGRAISL